jgi:hypothetical protein
MSDSFPTLETFFAKHWCSSTSASPILSHVNNGVFHDTNSSVFLHYEENTTLFSSDNGIIDSGKVIHDHTDAVESQKNRFVDINESIIKLSDASKVEPRCDKYAQTNWQIAPNTDIDIDNPLCRQKSIVTEKNAESINAALYTPVRMRGPNTDNLNKKLIYSPDIDISPIKNDGSSPLYVSTIAERATETFLSNNFTKSPKIQSTSKPPLPLTSVSSQPRFSRRYQFDSIGNAVEYRDYSSSRSPRKNIR